MCMFNANSVGLLHWYWWILSRVGYKRTQLVYYHLPCACDSCQYCWVNALALLNIVRSRTSKDTSLVTAIYHMYKIIELLHWHWWILSRVGYQRTQACLLQFTTCMWLMPALQGYCTDIRNIDPHGISKDASLFTAICHMYVFVCVEFLLPSQPNGVMSSTVSLPNQLYWAGLVL